MKRLLIRSMLLATLGALMTGQAMAQAASAATNGRDPMRWPAAMRQAAEAAERPASDGDEPDVPKWQLLFVDGRRYVLKGTQRFGIGDRLGDAVLVRIEPDAIWLRQDGTTRREPLHPQVQLRSAEPAPAASQAKPMRRHAKTRPLPAAAAAASASEVQP